MVTPENVLLIDENFTMDSFRETIFNQINDPRNTASVEASPYRNNSDTPSRQNSNQIHFYYSENDFVPDSDADLIHQQNKELRELERKEEEKKRKEIREKEEIERKFLEEKKQQEEKEIHKKMLISKLPPEPEGNTKFIIRK
jgi:hypothetical protein